MLKVGAATRLDQAGLVVIPAVLVNTLAEHGVKSFQLIHTVAFTLLYNQIKQGLQTEHKTHTPGSFSNQSTARHIHYTRVRAHSIQALYPHFLLKQEVMRQPHLTANFF